MRFVVLDLCFGVAWMSNVIAVVRVDEGASTFILFVMLLVVAVSSMLASSLPLAMFAATAPVTHRGRARFRAARRRCTTTSSPR